ncbi:LOW QUALITY PROTEIN: hypothetical protein ACHAW6_006223, partial [Cyclotella cf. meneghiniana]
RLTFSPEPSDDEASSLEAPSLSAELARWQFILGHLAFDKSCRERGNPQETEECHGAMTTVPWRTKEQHQSKVFVGSAPPLTNFNRVRQAFWLNANANLPPDGLLRHHFCQSFLRLRYIHFMTAQTSTKTLQAKQAHTKFATEQGPHHVRNINLVLNLETGLCSSQFHFRYDDFFETISLNKPDMMIPSNWQILAGLERPNQLPSVEQLLQVRNCASVSQGNNVTEKQPADDFSIIPEEFSMIDFGNGESPQLLLNKCQLRNLKESRFPQLLASVPVKD